MWCLRGLILQSWTWFVTGLALHSRTDFSCLLFTSCISQNFYTCNQQFRTSTVALSGQDSVSRPDSHTMTNLSAVAYHSFERRSASEASCDLFRLFHWCRLKWAAQLTAEENTQKRRRLLGSSHTVLAALNGHWGVLYSLSWPWYNDVRWHRSITDDTMAWCIKNLDESRDSNVQATPLESTWPLAKAAGSSTKLSFMNQAGNQKARSNATVDN